MKYYTRTITITGTLTIGVAAENLADARKIFDSIIEDEVYSLYDLQVDETDWNENEDEEVSENTYRVSDYRASEKESKEILDYVNEDEEDV